MLRDLLVYVTPDAAGKHRLAYTIDLASAFGARLTGIHVLATPDVPPVFKPSRVAAVNRDLQEFEREKAKKSAALFESATRDRSLNASWRLSRGKTVERVCQQARYADLIIVGHEPTEIAAERSPLSLADELVLKSGRPVLLLPDVEMPVAPPKRALIAWDGSREAVRAVHDALPLLEHADVSLVLVANREPEQIDDDVARGEELLDHLGRHKVIASAATSLRLNRPEADVILGYLKEHKVDLLVMGGFGHWAWRELLFGGTTAGLMREAPVPVLISH